MWLEERKREYDLGVLIFTYVRKKVRVADGARSIAAASERECDLMVVISCWQALILRLSGQQAEAEQVEMGVAVVRVRVRRERRRALGRNIVADLKGFVEEIVC